jgi:hypothetical protein
VREIKMQQTEDEVATDLVGQAEEVTDREEADDEIETAREARPNEPGFVKKYR